MITAAGNTWQYGSTRSAEVDTVLVEIGEQLKDEPEEQNDFSDIGKVV